MEKSKSRSAVDLAMDFCLSFKERVESSPVAKEQPVRSNGVEVEGMKRKGENERWKVTPLCFDLVVQAPRICVFRPRKMTLSAPGCLGIAEVICNSPRDKTPT